MELPSHALPLIARTQLVDAVLDRLQRPGDVRNTPKDFIQPGFYGLAGVGKSRLLAEVSHRARQLTPYVVSLDFDSIGNAPATPFALVNRLIGELETIEKEVRKPWQRLYWRKQNPFAPCRAIMDTIERQPKPDVNIKVDVEQSLEASGSTVTDTNFTSKVTNTVTDIGEAQVSQELRRAFDEALTGLTERRPWKDRFGVPERKSTPLVVVVLDTVEMAARPLRRWLVTELNSLWPRNRLQYHVQVVAAGRERMDGWMETALPPLTPEGAVEFVRAHALHHHQSRRPLDQKVLSTFREDTPTRRAIVEMGEGIPLLLGLLSDIVIDTPALLPEFSGELPKSHDARIQYVLARYLERLEAAAHTSGDDLLWQRYHLLRAAAVPRRIGGTGILQALLADLEGTPFDKRSNYTDLLAGLRRESFVQSDSQGRLRYHQVVREGVLAELKEDKARWQTLHGRAAAWFAAQGEGAEELYHQIQADPAATFAKMRAAIERALDGEAWQEAQQLIGAAGEIALPAGGEDWLTLYKGELAWGEGNQALANLRLQVLTLGKLDDALAQRLAERLEQWYGLTPTAEAGEPEPKLPPHLPLLLVIRWARVRSLPRYEASALLGLADTARALARYDEAAQQYEAALTLFRRIGDLSGEASALRGLADTARALARYDEAAQHGEAALTLCRRIGDQRGEAYALRGLAATARALARYDEAAQQYEAALTLFRRIGDQRGEASALRGLADTARALDRYDEAAQQYEAALTLFRRIGDLSGEASALLGLADTARALDRYDEAAQQYEAALTLFRRIGDLSGEASALRGLADTARALARYDEAAQQYEAALTLFRRIGDLSGEASALRGLADTARALARYDEAAQQYEAALTLFRRIGDQRGEASALLGLAATARALDRYDEAAQQYEAALTLFRRIGDLSGEASALLGLAATARALDRYDEAAQQYEAALTLFRRIGDLSGEASALLGLADTARALDRYDDCRLFFAHCLTLVRTIHIPAVGLNWSIVLGLGLVDALEKHRTAGEAALAQQAYGVATQCYQWAEEFATHPHLPESARNYLTAYHHLGARLAQYG